MSVARGLDSSVFAARPVMPNAAPEPPAVLVYRLAERLAFERSSCLLYAALVTKSEAEGDLAARADLQRILADEQRHRELVAAALRSLGQDPGLPGQDVDHGGADAMRQLEFIHDPESTLRECLQAILFTELVYNDGWRLLVNLAAAAGLRSLAEAFAAALADEDDHLERIRAWLGRGPQRHVTIAYDLDARPAEGTAETCAEIR